ncbi:L-fucose mutarotase [Coraliomargarita sp. SDUM461004]|uniref:L-fucose mutarotase n=1 Tax=Thalassobacterium sedimentorum TaxID=3041258 RepID=A0ABU1AMZ3_9BACT|nr:L-fucose mutarotase [Coraliomargarita sp. SDUM461004]MDQ8196072.1 L-fucose mutarotase [Coraliomargarita sp. SDUM461004]
MLNGISPLISPELLNALYRMGHGDEIILADAHFPGDSFGQRVIRADGLNIPELLEAILPLFPLDPYAEASLAMMAPVPGDTLDSTVEQAYRNAMVNAGVDRNILIERVERFAFYERAKTNYAVVMTGEMAKYGNLILKKGLANI